jgi:hypothetical protein
MRSGIAILAALFAFTTGTAFAEPPAYPEKGQDAAAQNSDKAQCRMWAMEQSGFDPAQPPPQPVAAAQQRGGVVRGAAVGGATGAIIDDKGGEGAAAGALIGGMRQRSRNKQAQQQASATNQQAMAAYNNGQARYNSAWGTCMQARGYRVG